MESTQRPVFALALRLGGALMFATMMLLIKLAGEAGVHLFEIMFWRQALSVVVVLGWLTATRQLALLRTERLPSHGRRAVTGMVCMVFNFGATILLPLAVATTLGFAAPLFAVLIAGLVLGERVGVWRWSAVLLGFTGVVVIAQPGGEAIDPLGAAAGLLAALLVAAINHQLRDLGRTEPPLRSVLYFALFGAVLMLPALPFTMSAHDGYQWLLLGGLGLLGTFGQIFLTSSLRFGAVASVIAMDYTMLIWAMLFGWLVWDQTPGWTTWLGAPLIVGAGLIVVWREHRLFRRQPPTAAAIAD